MLPPILLRRTLVHVPFIIALLFTNVQSQSTPLVSPCPVVLPTTRIVGGTLTDEPYLVFLRTTLGQCSGTLITPTHVLTARHCRISTSSRVFISSTDGPDGTEIPIIATDDHPSVDITLVTLARPSNVRPVKILTDTNLPTPWSFVRVQGFGIQTNLPFPSDKRQRFVDIPVVSSNLCERFHENTRDEDNQLLSADPNFPDGFVCTGYLESASCSFCSGDSGGPVLAFLRGDPVLVGVISAGVGCGLPDRPGVSVRVASNIGWLDGLRVSYNGVTELDETFVEPQAPGGVITINSNTGESVNPQSAAPAQAANTGLAPGAIAGIAVGAAVVALLVIIAAVFIIRRKRSDPDVDDGEVGQEPQEGGNTLLPTSQSGGPPELPYMPPPPPLSPTSQSGGPPELPYVPPPPPLSPVPPLPPLPSQPAPPAQPVSALYPAKEVAAPVPTAQPDPLYPAKAVAAPVLPAQPDPYALSTPVGQPDPYAISVSAPMSAGGEGTNEIQKT